MLCVSFALFSLSIKSFIVSVQLKAVYKQYLAVMLFVFNNFKLVLGELKLILIKSSSD